MPSVVPDDIAYRCPVTSLHAIVVHGGTRPLEEVEAWVERTLESLLPKEGQSSEHVVGRETHAWTPQGFPRPVRATGIFLKSDRDSRNALSLGRDLRTKVRDAFCQEHPGGASCTPRWRPSRPPTLACRELPHLEENPLRVAAGTIQGWETRISVLSSRLR